MIAAQTKPEKPPQNHTQSPADPATDLAGNQTFTLRANFTHHAGALILRMIDDPALKPTAALCSPIPLAMAVLISGWFFLVLWP